ncbi:MAG TPA: diguanylate cyclase [bacterium]|nr:diguanylate cyclase [bacterium]
MQDKAGEAKENARLDKHHILIVDDEEENLDLLVSTLRRGNKIFKARSGEEALEILKTEQVHLVITDQRMPGISGIELLSILQERHPETGRMLITGYGDMQTAVDAINKGQVQRFVSKPWDPAAIKEMVAQELERYDLVDEKKRLTNDVIDKNRELEEVNEILVEQKSEMEKLADEYRRQRELAIEMSEKFAKANLELIKAQEEIKLKNTKLESANKKLEQLSVTDGLTGFFNYRQMLNILDNEIGRAKRYNLYLSVMMIDLDKFKNINDTFGHLFGDAVLRRTTEIIRRNIRETDFPTRYGGDEFLIILPHTGIDRAKFLAKRIHADLKSHPFLPPEGQRFYLTVSIGIAYYPHSKVEDREGLVKLVDEALYEAKEGGRDRIVVTPG